MDHTKFILKVTAGHEYKNQHEVHVNTSKPYQLDTPYLSATIHVRVQDFRGLPKSSPSTSPYFSHPLHTTDRYSISFRFTPKSSINGNDLVFGNDFDHPIRDRLPPGFGYAFNYVKSWIDPGLDGDPMSDEPWLYGPLLSSVNVLRIGGQRDEKGGGQPEEKAERKKEHEGEHAQIEKDDEEVDVVEEGASDTSGEEVREQLGLPDDSKSRMKFFLDEMKRKEFEFEQGRCYSCDFFNGYLDFNEFALRLPLGFTMNIVRYWDGQPLRYVLRNRANGTLLFVVSFNLVPTDGKAREAAEKQASTPIAPVANGEDDEDEHSEDAERGEGLDRGYVDDGVD